MTGVVFSWGIPFSPWQAAQSCAFSSIVCARAAVGSKLVATNAMSASGGSARRAARRSAACIPAGDVVLALMSPSRCRSDGRRPRGSEQKKTGPSGPVCLTLVVVARCFGAFNPA
jgi:hypothetical protein